MGDEPREAFSLAERNLETLGRRGRHAVDHVFQLAAQSRDGGTQLVGDVCHEVAAELIRAGKLGGHRIKRRRELPHLVARFCGDAPAVISERHGLRCDGHFS